MPDPRRNRLKTVLGVAASVAIAALATYVLYRTFQRVSLSDVLERMREVPVRVLVTAALLSAGSFLALALYEIAIVRYVKHPLGIAKPMITALIAFPIGHAVGQATLSGGAIRYRMYTPAGFSAMEVGATVLMAVLPYLLAFGLLLDLSLVFGAEHLGPYFRISEKWLVLLGCLGLAKDLGYLVLVHLRRAPVKLGGWAVNLPSPAMTALQYLVGLIDVTFVSSVMYVLLPESAGMSYLPFVAIYLASVLAGMLAHVPAGIGVLESMLLLLLPHVPPDELLASVLLYRVIYEIGPLLVALILWGGFELVARDGVGLRLLRGYGARRPAPGTEAPHERSSGAASPTIDNNE